MKWVKALMLLVIPLPMLMTGCGTQITSGKVVEKYLVPEHEEDNPDIVVSYDPYMTIPGGTHTVPDAWYIVIEKEDEDGEVKQRHIHVTRGLHDSLDVGDWYAIPKEE